MKDYEESSSYSIVLIDPASPAKENNTLYFKISCEDLGLIENPIKKNLTSSTDVSTEVEVELIYCDFPSDTSSCSKDSDSTSEKYYLYENTAYAYSRCIISSDCEATLDKVPILKNITDD